jgi:hypothetical protein
MGIINKKTKTLYFKAEKLEMTIQNLICIKKKYNNESFFTLIPFKNESQNIKNSKSETLISKL